MNSFDENNYEKAEIRHQYELMMELESLMKKEKERLELQMRENYVSLINRKKSLYNPWIFSFVDFDSGIKKVNEYINKLKKKEIRKNAKCEEKSYYEIMMEHIEFETGIKVKSIDDVTFWGYGWGYHIYFTDAKYGKPLRWYVPNLKASRYQAKMYYGYNYGKDNTPDFVELLYDLDMKLSYVKEKTENYESLEYIASFPNDVQKFEDFGKRLDERFGGSEENHER
jgi:hypothetical protein